MPSLSGAARQSSVLACQENTRTAALVVYGGYGHTVCLVSEGRLIPVQLRYPIVYGPRRVACYPLR